jgi:RHS repeat-associated protein
MGDVILEDRCTELLDNSHPAKQAASTDKVVSIGSADTGKLQSSAGSILYLHEPNAFRPLVQIRSEQADEGDPTESIYYYHLDHIGTPLELTDEQGRIVWQANYTGFGQARIINSGITNLIRYPGQYEDSEIGLHYNRFRYYDPNSGQYTQQDPIGLMGGEQLSQYVADPVNWVDVLGLQGDCPETVRVRHYTNKSSAKKIEDSGEITGSDHGRVYFESASKKPLSPQKAVKKHKIKNADSYVETDVPKSSVEMVKNPLTGVQEITVKGSVPLSNSTVVHRK